MLTRQPLSQADRLAKLLERGAYKVTEAEARADWQGDTQRARFEGAAQADNINQGRPYFGRKVR